MGWIRSRAWTPGFSSAERTYSSAPRGWPSKNAGVQVQHPAGFEPEVGVAGEDPGSVLPGFERVGGQPAPHGRGRDRGHHSAAGGFGGQVRARPLRQRHRAGARQLTGQRLHLRDLDGAELAWPPGSGPVSQSGQPFPAEASTPFADGVDVQPEIGRDRGIGPAVGGGQDDLGAEHVAVSGPGPVRPAGQLLMFLGGQDDHKRGRDDHDLVVPQILRPGDMPRRAADDPAPSGSVKMVPMAKIPASTQTSLRQRLTSHARAALAPDQDHLHPLPRRLRLRRRRTRRRRNVSGCAGCATADRPTSGASPSTAPATTTTKTPTCPTATPSAPAKKPSTPPAAST